MRSSRFAIRLSWPPCLDPFMSRRSRGHRQLISWRPDLAREAFGACPADLTGLRAGDGHAVAVAPLGVVVPHRQVHGAAVVPEGDRVRLPLEAAFEIVALG